MTDPDDLTTDDLTLLYTQRIGCRHVSSNSEFLKHRTQAVLGDTYAIGAIDILTYPPEVRKSTQAYHDAALTGEHNPFDAIQTDGKALVTSYKEELRRMVAHAVAYDQHRGGAQECRFLIYKDVQGARMANDLEEYPFGKSGQEMLSPDNFCFGIFIGQSVKDELNNDPKRITDYLTDKLIHELHKYCERSRAEEIDQQPAIQR